MHWSEQFVWWCFSHFDIFEERFFLVSIAHFFIFYPFISYPISFPFFSSPHFKQLLTAAPHIHYNFHNNRFIRWNCVKRADFNRLHFPRWYFLKRTAIIVTTHIEKNTINLKKKSLFMIHFEVFLKESKTNRSNFYDSLRCVDFKLILFDQNEYLLKNHS